MCRTCDACFCSYEVVELAVTTPLGKLNGGAGGTVVSNYGTIFIYCPSISDHNISNTMASNLGLVSIAFEGIPWSPFCAKMLLLH